MSKAAGAMLTYQGAPGRCFGVPATSTPIRSSSARTGLTVIRTGLRTTTSTCRLLFRASTQVIQTATMQAKRTSMETRESYRSAASSTWGPMRSPRWSCASYAIPTGVPFALTPPGPIRAQHNGHLVRPGDRTGKVLGRLARRRGPERRVHESPDGHNRDRPHGHRDGV